MAAIGQNQRTSASVQPLTAWAKQWASSAECLICAFPSLYHGFLTVKEATSCGFCNRDSGWANGS